MDLEPASALRAQIPYNGLPRAYARGYACAALRAPDPPIRVTLWRPRGTRFPSARYPPLQRWAIFFRPQRRAWLGGLHVM